jgi:hypothetical protein
VMSFTRKVGRAKSSRYRSRMAPAVPLVAKINLVTYVFYSVMLRQLPVTDKKGKRVIRRYPG